MFIIFQYLFRIKNVNNVFNHLRTLVLKKVCLIKKQFKTNYNNTILYISF